MTSYVSQNPFRVLSVPSNSSAKDIHKNLSKLKAYSKIGKVSSFSYDFNFFNLAEIDRSESVLSNIENKIISDENKVKYSLFWFVNHTPIDSVALDNLSNGNVDKSIEVWKKATDNKDISETNFSSFNNLATLMLFKSLDSTKSDQFLKGDAAILNIRNAINLKSELLSSKSFNSFSDLVTKSSSTVDLDLIKTFFIKQLLESLKKNYSNKELFDLFDSLSNDLRNTFMESLVDEPIRNINQRIREANEAVEENHSKGISIGKKLIKDTFKELKQIKDLIGKEDYQYQSTADKLSNQIMQCGILCFNKTKEDYDYLSSYKYALTIAVDSKTINRAKDSIKHCEEQKNATICKLCNEFEINDRKKVRVKMHRMQYGGSYNYFKDGGLPITCCDNCRKKIFWNKFLAFLVPTILLTLVMIITGGIYILIELFFIRLMLLRGT